MVLFEGPHIEFLGHLDNLNKTKLNTNILCYLLAIVLQTKFHEMVCQSTLFFYKQLFFQNRSEKLLIFRGKNSPKVA